jgi:hypothetical protein
MMMMLLLLLLLLQQKKQKKSLGHFAGWWQPALAMQQFSESKFQNAMVAMIS